MKINYHRNLHRTPPCSQGVKTSSTNKLRRIFPVSTPKPLMKPFIAFFRSAPNPKCSSSNLQSTGPQHSAPNKHDARINLDDARINLDDAGINPDDAPIDLGNNKHIILSKIINPLTLVDLKSENKKTALPFFVIAETNVATSNKPQYYNASSMTTWISHSLKQQINAGKPIPIRDINTNLPIEKITLYLVTKDHNGQLTLSVTAEAQPNPIKSIDPLSRIFFQFSISDSQSMKLSYGSALAVIQLIGIDIIFPENYCPKDSQPKDTKDQSKHVNNDLLLQALIQSSKGTLKPSDIFSKAYNVLSDNYRNHLKETGKFDEAFFLDYQRYLQAIFYSHLKK